MNQHQRRGRPQSGLITYLVYALIIAGLVALAGLFAGCTGRVVVLRHPETKQVTECRAARGTLGGPAVSGSGIEQCVSAYRKAGFVVVGDSD